MEKEVDQKNPNKLEILKDECDTGNKIRPAEKSRHHTNA